jgi:NAD(P) transhydrogenase subunit beta
MITSLVNIGYLVGALAFVLGLRRLSSPDTARKGNLLALAGMLIAILASLVAPIEGSAGNFAWIAGGITMGALVGWIASRKVKMTDMPQMVSIFNGLGGACAALLGIVELQSFYAGTTAMTEGPLSVVLMATLIGAVSFTGSLLAYAKLQGLINDNTLALPKHNLLNIALLIVTLSLGVYLVTSGPEAGLTIGMIFLALSLVYGFSFVIPIGGADMPVVISLLNSFTGLSAAAAGLIYGNTIMLVGGILVGASGTILTVLMCQAMNRSLLNVLIGGFGGPGKSKEASGDQNIREISISDSGIQLFYSSSVVFVPGYGLAVAQAQKVVKELDDLLEQNGVEVRYAIHPVAGRMPGHMNVLLAEADVPYPKLLDLVEANDFIRQADLVVVIGANDVVNPAALDDPGSPIYGMPVLEVWRAKSVVVMKRSMSPGYAGIQNPLFFHERTKMLFGDAKASLQKLVSEVKAL